MALEVCPLCSSPGYVEIRKTRHNTYYYFVHEYYENGERRRKRCYLGPKDYKYVTIKHDFILHGMPVLGREVEYLSSVVDALITQQNFDALKKLFPSLLEAKRELDALVTHVQAILDAESPRNFVGAGDEISLENFAKHLATAGNSESTVKKKVAIVRKFLASVDVPLPRIAEEHIHRFLSNCGYSDVNYVRKTLREFFEFLGSERLANAV